MNSDIKPWWKGKWGGVKLYLVAIGTLLVLAAHLAPMLIQWLALNLGETPFLDDIVAWLTKHSPKLYIFAFPQIIFGALLYIMHFMMDRFWLTHINPHIERHLEILNETLRQSRHDTKEIIGSSSFELAINHSEPKIVKNALQMAHGRAFGTHCNKPKGLYSELSTTVGRYLEAAVPHRSSHHQHIVIRKGSDNKFLWNETTTYNLHTIILDDDYDVPDEKQQPIRYMLSVSTHAQYDDLKSLKLKLYFDSQEIANTQDLDLDSLELSDGKLVSLEEGLFTLRKEGSEIYIVISREVEINKAEIKVRIEEESTILDNFFIARRDQPTCGLTISMQIPDGYKFDYIGVPPGTDEPDKVTEQHRTVKKEGWVLPGIIMSCQWSPKTPGEQV